MTAKELADRAAQIVNAMLDKSREERIAGRAGVASYLCLAEVVAAAIQADATERVARRLETLDATITEKS